MSSPAKSRLTVLVVEDDPLVRRSLGAFVQSAGHRSIEASGVEEAVESFRREPPGVVLADYALGDGNAFDLLQRLPQIDAGVPIVVMTGHGSIDLAVSAMRRGAYHFVTKPARPAEILRLLEGAVEERRGSEGGADLDPFAGDGAAIRRLAAETRRLMVSDGPILIRGETGAGKTMLARWIHRHSPRAAGPFVRVDCAGLSREVSDSELFGHEKGSFPGARARRAGLVESADGGTLFLDEIGDLDPAVQGKLLRVVEEGRFARQGGAEERRADVRLVAATQRDLERRVAEGAFREDLYFRLGRLPLVVPPLRERLEDLPALAERILAGFAPARARGTWLTPGALARLRGHPWRGNVRQLRNVLERTALLADDPALQADDLRLEVDVPASAAEERATTLADVERRHIERTLAAVGYRVAEAARVLGVPRSTLYQRIRESGIALKRR